ncbi:MAG: hypothetical protein FJW39_28745, partial [Acidobacteria bacterium]|nr:hypothetical protein [Acidobacteriota bacterium]
MRLIALLSLAAVSLAARPRYGGALTVELRGTVQALDPTAADSVDAQRLPLLLFDRLVALDGTPSLAVSWVAEDNQR